MPRIRRMVVKGEDVVYHVMSRTAFNELDRFLYRTRYFSDSGIIGAKAFVVRHYQKFRHHFSCEHEKQPTHIKVLGVFIR